MAKVVKRTFSLTEAQAKFIDRKVASGSYASGSEVVRAGLREIEEWDATLDRWLQQEVLPTLRKLDEDPERARPLDEVFDEMLAELEEQEPPARRRA